MGTSNTTSVKCFRDETSAVGAIELTNLLDDSKTPEVYEVCWYHKNFYEKKTAKLRNIGYKFKPFMNKVKNEHKPIKHDNRLGKLLSKSEIEYLENLKKSLAIT